jgi:two-component system response regulator AtoC
MVVLGNEQAVVEEIRTSGARYKEGEDVKDSMDLHVLGADFSSEQQIDLKAISRRAAQIAEKGVIEKVLNQTRWNRKEAAERLQISYKALLYKMKENGLSQAR